MSIFAEITDEGLKLLEEAGHAVITFMSSERQKLVNLAKDSHLYTEFENAISNAESTFKGAKTGAEKMNWVIGRMMDLCTAWIDNGGWAGIFGQIQDFVRAVAQLIFNDLADSLRKVIHT